MSYMLHFSLSYTCLLPPSLTHSCSLSCAVIALRSVWSGGLLLLLLLWCHFMQQPASIAESCSLSLSQSARCVLRELYSNWIPAPTCKQLYVCVCICVYEFMYACICICVASFQLNSQFCWLFAALCLSYFIHFALLWVRVCVFVSMCVHSFVLSLVVVDVASPLAINTNLQHFRMFTRDFS